MTGTGGVSASLLRGFHVPARPLEFGDASGGIRVSDGEPRDLLALAGETIESGDGSVRFTFDPERLIDRLTSETFFPRGRPIHSFLPGGTGWLPDFLRSILFRTHVRWRLRKRDAFPRWPIEPCVEDLRRAVREAACRVGVAGAAEPFWPKGTAYAVVLSHDFDSVESYRAGRWKILAEMEEGHGFRSSWHFCSNHLPVAENVLEELSRRGHEIAWHGPGHDYRIAYRSPDEIRGIVDRQRSLLSRFSVNGFRSPFYLRTPALFEGIAGAFSYDSSARDTAPELFSPHRREGCCTVFPFFRSGVVELPITIPEDHYVSCLTGDDAENIHRIQLEKIEWIRSVGGMALVLTHPENWISMRPGAIEAYRMMLDYVAGDPGACVMLARDAAIWWRKRSGEKTVPGTQAPALSE